MQIYIDQDTIAKVNQVIELRHQYSAAVTAKTDEEITKIFALRDQIEELENQLGLQMIWKVAAAEAARKAG